MNRSKLSGAKMASAKAFTLDATPCAKPRRQNQASRRWRWIIAGMLGLNTMGGLTGMLNAAVTPTGDAGPSGSDYRVGYTADGQLRIDSASILNSSYGYMGYNAGVTGTATVTGPGSQWNNTSRLFVGYSGAGILTLENGGQVKDSTFVGYNAGSTGEVTISGDGSLLSGSLYIGEYGAGAVTVANGGQVSAFIQLGYGAGSSGKLTVTGVGSQCIAGDYFRIGRNGIVTVANGGVLKSHASYMGANAAVKVTGNGSQWIDDGGILVGLSFTVENGGLVTSGGFSLGSFAPSPGTGRVTVTGINSKWICSDFISVGNAGGTRTNILTLADGGFISASTLYNADNYAQVNLHVSGNDMLVLGNTATVGRVVNEGQINLYADAFLASGTYTPISDSAGRSMTWSGTGTYNPWGGTWSATNHTFTVSAPTALIAGASDDVTTGERLLITALDGQRMGASFGVVPAGTNFAASEMTSGPINALQAILAGDDQVLTGWDFTTNFTGGTVLLSFDLGLGLQQEDLKVWHYAGETWSAFAPDMLTYDSQGILSFTVSSFSGYAVTGVIPEPATLSLLALAAPALLVRRRAR